MDLTTAIIALSMAVASMFQQETHATVAYVPSGVDLPTEVTTILEEIFTPAELAVHDGLAINWMTNPNPSYRAYVPGWGPTDEDCGSAVSCILVNQAWWNGASDRAKHETIVHEYGHVLTINRYWARGPNPDPWDAYYFNQALSALPGGGFECVAEGVSQLVAARAGWPQPTPIYACDGSALPLAQELLDWANQDPIVIPEPELGEDVGVATEGAVRSPAP